VHLERRPIDVRSVLVETLEEQTEAIERRGLELVTDLVPEPLWVFCDRVRVVQVFENLLSNAIKFTESPGTITVLARRDEEHAVITVRDTGVGIDPALLPHIFEPFRQAEQSLVRTPGGLGLGLAIVKGMVELHGGSVSVASQGSGRGAELTVRLPMTHAPRHRTEREPSSASPSRVLVVEDNEDAADTLRLVLETIGHEVAVAYDASSALEQLRSFDPQVVLCDIGLPGAMSGYDLARRIRADGSKVLLVAVTGYGRPEDIRRAREAGFDRHLTKPIGVAAIEEILSGRREVPKPR
jgi:CheY-like chemotaxis protein